MGELCLSENKIIETIERVLYENRTFLNLGNNGQQQAPPIPSEPAPMPNVPPMGNGQDMNGGMAPMDSTPDMGNEMPPADNGEEQFDTNFDAGVEADEETDPKHYIQQLTGKLSQSLNKFNGDQGGDSGLSKYVASMIVTAACKNLDDKAKKEIIEKINSASSEDNDISDDTEDEMPPMEQGQEDEENAPINERFLTKKDLIERFRNGHLTETGVVDVTNSMGYKNERPQEAKPQNKKIMSKAWKSKF